MTEGPTSFDFKYETVIAATTGAASEACVIAGTTSATCVAELTVDIGATSTAFTATTTLGPESFHYHLLEVTAGVEKLPAATVTATSGNPNSVNGAPPMVTGMGAAAVGLMGLAAFL